jgi:hypothetical protein
VEVWSVLSVAWLVRTAARVPTHMTTVSQAVDVRVEGIGDGYISKDLRTRILAEASSDRYHLSYLPTKYIVEWAEVAIVVGVTRLTGTTAWVTVSNLAACQAPYIRVELGAREYVCELDWASGWSNYCLRCARRCCVGRDRGCTWHSGVG